jgi:leucine-rich repeat-containing protein 49
LTKLDMHCHQIGAIDGLSTLSELRVLNLAGNQIAHLEARRLTGLTSLAELNLRRNLITSVAGVEALPALQRLFLSYNAINTLASVSCLQVR